MQIFGLITLVAVLVTVIAAAVDGGSDESDGTIGSQSAAVREIEDANVSVRADSDLCLVNALRAENLSGETVEVEAEVGFYHPHDGSLVEVVGPFLWELPPGYHDAIVFQLPGDFWYQHAEMWDDDGVVLIPECRIHNWDISRVR